MYNMNGLYNTNNMNGRVQIPDNQHFKIFNMYETQNQTDHAFSKEAMRGTHTENMLSEVFFSKKNLDALQDGIRYQVFLTSGKKHIIDNQSINELKLIMRAFYLEHARYSDTDCLKETISEVRRLNELIINYCVQKILEEINMYLRYKADINQLPIPIPRSENTSSKGVKVLELKQF